MLLAACVCLAVSFICLFAKQFEKLRMDFDDIDYGTKNG